MTTEHNRRRELGRLLVDRSLERGQFELSSGKEATYYVDVKKTALSGRGATLLGAALWELVSQISPSATAVGGLTLGADPLVTAVSMAAWAKGIDLGAIIVRKEPKGHGTQRFLERPDSVEAGDEVIAIDDVITTGGSTLDAIEQMRRADLVVRRAVCVVDREDTGEKNLADAGVRLHPLFTLSELLDIRGSQ